MICQFSFRNFKSYKGEITFDFQASSLPEFSDSLITREKCNSLLPVGVVYGPNGGGKTNLLQALTCLVSTVTKPIHDLEKNRKSFIKQQRVTAVPFLFDEVTVGEPTAFQIFFRTEAHEYRYDLSLLSGGVTLEILERKKIGDKKSARIFSREGEMIHLGAILKKEGVNTNINARMPFVSFLAINYNIPLIAEVQEWFESCIICSYADPIADPIAEMPIMVTHKEDYRKQVLSRLNDMGIDVTDYRFDEEEHQLYIKRMVGGNEYELPFIRESDGTKKLIATLPVLLVALREGRLVVIDELDTKLHPKLLEYVVSMFKNPRINKCGAQLLFTSHDMATMKNTVFRRDEIWFAALDDGHSSEVYSLYEIRREDHGGVNGTAAFDKQYLEGRYGADPYLQNVLEAIAGGFETVS